MMFNFEMNFYIIIKTKLNTFLKTIHRSNAKSFLHQEDSFLLIAMRKLWYDNKNHI